jgi:hypothetical protein
MSICFLVPPATAWQRPNVQFVKPPSPHPVKNRLCWEGLIRGPTSEAVMWLHSVVGWLTHSPFVLFMQAFPEVEHRWMVTNPECGRRFTSRGH